MSMTFLPDSTAVQTPLGTRKWSKMARRAIVISEGSRGDVEPLIAVALELENRGWDVSFAANHDFSEFCYSRGIKQFLPLKLSAKEVIVELMQDLAGSMTADDIQKGITKWRHRTIPYRVKEFEEYCSAKDLIICNGNLNTFAMQIAEAYNTPMFITLFAPWFPNPALRPCFYGGRQDEGINFVPYYAVAFKSFTEQFLAPMNEWRKKLGLKEMTGELALMEQMCRTRYYVNCWSEEFTPMARNAYPESCFFSGWLRPIDNSPLCGQLAQFMEAAKRDNVAPIYVGFGSATHPHAEWFSKQVLGAIEMLAKEGFRVVICEGWGALQRPKRALDAPEGSFIFVEDCNHSALLPYCSCAVIHGGAGTTAAAAIAGIPIVVTPVLFDQPFWGNCIGDLRIGPYPIIGAELNPQRLAQEIRNAIGNEEFKRHGKALSEKLRKENGVNRLLDEIERKIRPVQRL